MNRKEIQARLYESTAEWSAGDWESLTYKKIDASIMRQFVHRLNMYGNGIDCRQEAVDDIESMLARYPNYEVWAAEPKHKQLLEWAMGSAFIWLFAAITRVPSWDVLVYTTLDAEIMREFSAHPMDGLDLPICQYTVDYAERYVAQCGDRPPGPTEHTSLQWLFAAAAAKRRRAKKNAKKAAARRAAKQAMAKQAET